MPIITLRPTQLISSTGSIKGVREGLAVTDLISLINEETCDEGVSYISTTNMGDHEFKIALGLPSDQALPANARAKKLSLYVNGCRNYSDDELGACTLYIGNYKYNFKHMLSYTYNALEYATCKRDCMHIGLLDGLNTELKNGVLPEIELLVTMNVTSDALFTYIGRVSQIYLEIEYTTDPDLEEDQLADIVIPEGLLTSLSKNNLGVQKIMIPEGEVFKINSNVAGRIWTKPVILKIDMSPFMYGGSTTMLDSVEYSNEIFIPLRLWSETGAPLRVTCYWEDSLGNSNVSSRTVSNFNDTLMSTVAFGKLYGVLYENIPALAKNVFITIEGPCSSFAVGYYSKKPYLGKDKAAIGCIEEVLSWGSVDTLHNDTFVDCGKLASLTIPKSINAFKADDKTLNFGICGPMIDNCTNLTEIALEKDLEGLADDYVLFNSSNLQVINLGKDVTRFSKRWVNPNCELNMFKVDEENNVLSTINGNLVNKDGAKLIAYPNLTGLVNELIPSTIKDIGSYAFYGSHFEQIAIPDTVESIDEYAFSNCSALTEMVLPEYPPELKSVNAFENTEISKFWVVDTASKARYEAADNWKEFAGKYFSSSCAHSNTNTSYE